MPLRRLKLQQTEPVMLDFQANDHTNFKTATGRARNTTIVTYTHDGAYQKGAWSCCGNED